MATKAPRERGYLAEDPASPAFSPLDDHLSSTASRNSNSGSPYPPRSRPAPKTGKRQASGGRKSAAKRPRVEDKMAASKSARRLPAEPKVPERANYTNIVRLQKCSLIHYIDTTYTQLGIEPPSQAELGRELHLNIPDLYVRDKTSLEMKPRNREQVTQLLHSIFRTDCTEEKTSVIDFLRNPTACLTKRLLYDEYCASLEPVLPAAGNHDNEIEDRIIADSNETAPSPATALTHVLPGQVEKTSYASTASARLANRGSAGIGLFDDPLATARGNISHESRGMADSPQQHLGNDGQDQARVVDDAQLAPWSFNALAGAGVPPRGHLGSEPSPRPYVQAAPQSGNPRHNKGTTSSSVQRGQPLRQQDQIVRAIQADPRPPPIRAFDNFLPDETRYTLDTGLLSDGLMKIYSQAKSRIHQDFAARGITGRPPTFLVNPPLGLQQLYLMVTGSDKAKAVKSAIVVGASAESLSLSLFGAFLVRVVFGGSEVETFDVFQAKPNDSGATFEIDQALQELRTNYDTVLRKAYLRRILNGHWTKRHLAPIADRLSDDFAVRLEQHLGVDHGVGGQVYGPTMYALSERFSRIIFDALVFKCTISTSREETGFVWSRGEEKIDSDTMEGYQDGHERVLLAEFPGFELREAGQEPEVVFKAQVLSKRQ